MPRSTVPIFRYPEYGIRTVFIATTTSLLGVTGYIAAHWGSEHIEKVYAVAITGSIISILSDFVAFVLMSLKPGAKPAVAVVDIIAIILCAISIPTIINSDFQNSHDGSAWKLAVVVVVERIISIAICLTTWILAHRQVAKESRPQIFDQKTLMSAATSQFLPSTAAPSTAASVFAVSPESQREYFGVNRT